MDAPIRRVIVVNNCYQLAPWADALFAMDPQWWRQFLPDVNKLFAGERYTIAYHVPGTRRLDQKEFKSYGNSGSAAVALAEKMGAERLTLIGYDCKRTPSRAHWHGNHGRGLGNAGSLPEWPLAFAELARAIGHLDVVNCSADTALKCWPRAALESRL